MFTLYKKEINAFFSSLTGYIVVAVFLLSVSLFMWVFPGQMNILDNGYASLDTLFFLAPWLFLFLIPAITMRSFAEERSSGTLEQLLTRPLSSLHIVVAKYTACLSVVLVALLPCLVYYYSIYVLGCPQGNIDSAGTVGSFMGLFFLAAAYSAAGIFASSMSSNQVVSFIVAVVLSFILFTGFDYIGSMAGKAELFVRSLGINYHYESMSRGVIDSRDILYSLSVVAILLSLTKTVIENKR